MGDASCSADTNETDIPYLGLAIIFSVLMFGIEYYLSVRQLRKFRQAKEMPVELKLGGISEDIFKKSLSYGKDKLSFGMFETSALFIESTVLVLAGYLPYAWDLSKRALLCVGISHSSYSPLVYEMLITSVFVAIMSLHDTIVTLPFSLYSTFVVEEKHGFNKSTMALFFKDKLMTLLLTLVIGAPILSGVVWVVRWGGPHFYFYVWAFLCTVSITLMTVYPTLIAPLFNKYTKLEDGPIYSAISELSKTVSFPLTQIYLVDGSKRSAHSNAYFYGFFKSKRIVMYDTLVNQVELPELLAILGHEIGHWKLWHTIQGFVIMQLYQFVLFLTFSAVQNTPALFSAFGFRYCASSAGGEYATPVFVGLMLFTQTFWSPVDKALSLVMNFNSRANEFAADRFSNKLGMGDALKSGLVKISVENLGNMVPDELYSLYHFSHPPLVERLKAIGNGSQKKKD